MCGTPAPSDTVRGATYEREDESEEEREGDALVEPVCSERSS